MRYPSIDLLRTLAIVLMVLVHFVENLSGAGRYVLLPTGFGAPLFALLAGVSFRLWLRGQERRGTSESEITKRTIRRGLFLLGVGFVFNVVVWLPEDTFNWDVLTFLGAAMLLLAGIRHLPSSLLLLISVVAFAISPALRTMSDYDAYWTKGYFEGDLTLSDVLLGFLANGYFPFLPWVIYPVTGFAIAPLVFTASDESRRTTAAVAVTGVLLMVASLGAVASRWWIPAASGVRWLAGWTMFPPSPEYLLGTLGLGLVALTATHHWCDGCAGWSPSRGLLAVATTLSGHSLSIYWLHHLVHIWPLWVYGLATGDEPTQFWQQALPVTVAVPLSVVFLVTTYFLFRWLDRRGYGGIETLMRWLCD